MSSSTSPSPPRGKVANGRMRADAQHRTFVQPTPIQNLRALPAALIRPAGTFSQWEKGEGVL